MARKTQRRDGPLCGCERRGCAWSTASLKKRLRVCGPWLRNTSSITHGSVCLAHVETEYCPVRFSDMLEPADRRRSPYVSGADRDVGDNPCLR